MKRLTAAFALLLCLAAGSTLPTRTPSVPRAGRITGGTQLLDLVPATVLVAVQIRDLERRWSEIRSNEPIAQLQDAILEALGIVPERVPLLASSQAIFMLARSDDEPFIVPIVLLQPHDLAQARGTLAAVARISWRERGGMLWVGPTSASPLLERCAGGADPGLVSMLPFAEIESRLPGCGLVRGYVNPASCRLLVDSLARGMNFALPRWVASWLSAELSCLRYAAFRRDFVDGNIETEAVVAYDLAQLPPEVAQIFSPSRPLVPATPYLPAGALAAISFRPEASAWIPWLRYLSAKDPHGPLRNLAFWMEEFQRRYRRDLGRDLCGSIGENGWLFLLEGPGNRGVEAVALIETNSAPALAGTLADLLAWTGENAWLDSLGLLLPHSWMRTDNGIVARGLDFWTPLGARTCLQFTLSGKYLVLAGSESAIRAGLSIAEKFSRRLPATASLPVSSTFRLQGPVLVRLLRANLALTPGPEARLVKAIVRLISDIEEIMLDVSYEPDGVKLVGCVRFNGRL